MADPKSGNPENSEENKGALRDALEKADGSPTPLEKPADDETTEKQKGTTAEFAGAAAGQDDSRAFSQAEKTRIDETGTVITIDAKGRETITHVGTPKISMSSLFQGLWLILKAIFTGDWAGAKMLSEVYFPKKGYPDPNVEDKYGDFRRVGRTVIDDAYTYVIDNDLKNKSPAEQAAHFLNFIRESDLVQKMGAAPLLSMIVDKESAGGKTDLVYDYSGGTGFNPGDKTHAGLYVGIIVDKDDNHYFEKLGALYDKNGNPVEGTPEGLTKRPFSQSTINQVIAWQEEYKDEQRSMGIEPPSSALGAYQFVGNTLKEMVKDGLADGNAIFNLQTQTELAIKRAISMRGLGDLFKENISEARIREIATDLRDNEWVGLQNYSLEQVVDALKQMRETTLKNLGAGAFKSAHNVDLSKDTLVADAGTKPPTNPIG